MFELSSTLTDQLPDLQKLIYFWSFRILSRRIKVRNFENQSKVSTHQHVNQLPKHIHALLDHQSLKIKVTDFNVDLHLNIPSVFLSAILISLHFGTSTGHENMCLYYISNQLLQSGSYLDLMSWVTCRIRMILKPASGRTRATLLFLYLMKSFFQISYSENTVMKVKVNRMNIKK